MAYELTSINDRIRGDQRAFAEECEALFDNRVLHAAELIQANVKRSPIVLLSGPSGSGKTTTAKKLERELLSRGIGAYTVSLDHYFKTVDPLTAPRTPSGEIDYESPEGLDLALLNTHFTALEHGEEILIPHFSFTHQCRIDEKCTPMRLGRDGVAIFEGIHALNDQIAARHPGAFKLYISARADIYDRGQVLFKGTWTRLLRRVTRDNLFRGTPAKVTLSMWDSVRRGEKLYISPFKDEADFILNSSLAYEVPLMKQFVPGSFWDLDPANPRYPEFRDLISALTPFGELGQEYCPPDSILREFIGGGTFEY